MAGTLSAPRVSVRGALAPLMSHPTSSSTQVSQLLGGHSVDVVARDDQWRRVVGADGYTGWVHLGYLGTRARGGAGAPPNGWSCARLLSLGCTARTLKGNAVRLPLGAHVPRSAAIESGDALSLSQRRQTFRGTADAVLSSAERFYSSAPYVWGGVTPWGADCSGFVQSVCALHGITLPRDAWQQASSGVPVSDPDAVLPGDLLFFRAAGARRITHVAIASDRRSVVHLSVSRGGYSMDTLDRGDNVSRSLAAGYCGARRVLLS